MVLGPAVLGGQFTEGGHPILGHREKTGTNFPSTKFPLKH